jgi:hypothetical protein
MAAGSFDVFPWLKRAGYLPQKQGFSDELRSYLRIFPKWVAQQKIWNFGSLSSHP